MRPLAAALISAFMIAATGASAETRVFIIANQADGYGVDQCLARGEKCGDPDEITGSVPKTGAHCTHANCDQYVAITCQR
jgi:hypothetical protein